MWGNGFVYKWGVLCFWIHHVRVGCRVLTNVNVMRLAQHQGKNSFSQLSSVACLLWLNKTWQTNRTNRYLSIHKCRRTGNWQPMQNVCRWKNEVCCVSHTHTSSTTTTLREHDWRTLQYLSYMLWLFTAHVGVVGCVFLIIVCCTKFSRHCFFLLFFVCPQSQR